MLAEKFQKVITGLGMERLEHPLFYRALVGIRFEIGGEEPIYLDRSAARLRTNPAYVQGRWTGPLQSTKNLRLRQTFCESMGILRKKLPHPCCGPFGSEGAFLFQRNRSPPRRWMRMGMSILKYSFTGILA